MAIALVNHVSGHSSGTPTTSPPVDMTLNGGANLIVAMVAANTGTVQAITDSSSNTYTQAISFNSAFTRNTFYYCVSPTVTASMTFTATGQNFASICVAGFSGVDTAAAYDQHNSNVAAPTAGTIQTGSITPLANNELIIAVCGNYQSITSIDSGFTATDIIPAVGGTYQGSALAYLIQSTAAAVNPAWSVTTAASNTAGAAIASFKAAAGGGGGSTLFRKTLSPIMRAGSRPILAS